MRHLGAHRSGQIRTTPAGGPRARTLPDALRAHPGRVLVALLVATLVLAVVPLVMAPPAGATTSEEAAAESDYVERINDIRRQHGRGPLVVHSELRHGARSWSNHMANGGCGSETLCHDSNLASGVTATWTKLGENVGYGGWGANAQMMDLFMSSSGHRANLMDSSYTHVGVGVVRRGGTQYVTHRFMASPDSSVPGTPVPSTSTGDPLWWFEGWASARSGAVRPGNGFQPLGGDWNGDGVADVLWYKPGSGSDKVWYGTAGRQFFESPSTINGDYTPVVGDFDGDRLEDVLWYRPGRGADYVWYGRSSGGFHSVRTTINGDYEPIVGDFNGDRVADILWYRPGRGADYVWYGRSSGGFHSVRTTVNGDYAPVAGDLNGDGVGDILWYRPGRGADYVWYGRSSGGFHSVRTTINGTYRPFVGDFDGNRVDDIFWYAPGSRADYLWYHRSGGAVSSVRRTVNGTYTPVAGDFDGNRMDDVIWYTP